MDKKNNCVTVLANRNYIKYFSEFYKQLREIGKFEGDINLITDNGINFSSFKKKDYENLNVFKFKKIKYSNETVKQLNNIPNGRNSEKGFQWQKFYLFDEVFKKWDFNLYIDINMTIRSDINNLFNLRLDNKLVAPYDAYPDLDWSLESQFTTDKELLKELSQKYDLSLRKYFQTGILLYDTAIIKKNTFQDLINLVEKYPVSKNNEQGIMNLYFIFEKNQFEPLSKSVYSYWYEKNKKATITKR
jgi:hypothetical protein